MDCAGFNDSRGPEVNIANSVIIKTCVGEACGVVTVIVVNYHTLKSGRGRGLSELLELILGLFGTLDRVLAHVKSVLIGVSQVSSIIFPFPNALYSYVKTRSSCTCLFSLSVLTLCL